MINLKLGYPGLVGLLAMCVLAFSTFCSSQAAPSAEPPSPTESSQPPATNSPQQQKTGDQLPAPGKTDSSSPAATPDSNKPEDTKKKDDRMFYVMPNYLTVDSEGQTPPISWKEKFAISAKGSFDPYEFVIVGVVAAIRQADDSSPGFGQGAEGYFKRYGAAFADQVDGNIMTGGVYPTLLKTDPRYFRLGRGSFMKRFSYAFSRILVTRRDSGGSMFNIPEFAGNATAIAISTAYYPAADRSFSSSAPGWGTQMGLDAFGNELKEFWPDVHRYLQRRHARHMQKKEEKEAN